MATKSSKRTQKSQQARPAEPEAPSVPVQADDSKDTVVVAFRLTRAERDLIHAAAGPAKASSFVRRLAVAGARTDLKAVEEIVDGGAAE